MGREFNSLSQRWIDVPYEALKTEKQMGTTKITTKRTLILTIEELYKIIPDTKELEGRNFKNLKELLVNLIEKIEESGQWEFVQYVINTPSMFIVRELTVKEIFEYDKDQRSPEILRDKSRDVEKHLADSSKIKSEMSTSVLSGKLPWET